jgi:hypothetical protein
MRKNTNALGKVLCTALGIDPGNVHRIEFVADANDIPRVQVWMYAPFDGDFSEVAQALRDELLKGALPVHITIQNGRLIEPANQEVTD